MGTDQEFTRQGQRPNVSPPVIEALEQTRRHATSVRAVLAIGAAAVVLQWARFLTKKGLAAVLVACVVAVVAVPIIEQIKGLRKPTREG